MKLLVAISRILVGGLFIFSGFIKLNDPIGFAFKLEEYFGPTVFDLPFLVPYALILSILIVVFEVVLGVFLWIGYKPKFTVCSLLVMIVFFTFLTFYSAYFNKVTDCGCFGDAIKLTPWESFTKDLILLFFIIILVLGLKYIKPVFSKIGLAIASLLSFIACFAIVYHVLMHLPIVDFRPYKIGANIIEGMETPSNAKKPIIEYTYTIKVNGVDKVFVNTTGAYPSVTGDFVSLVSKEISAGYEPPIHDFTMEDANGTDFSDELLHQDKLIVLLMYNLSKAESQGLRNLQSIKNNALARGYKVIGLTATGAKEQQEFSNRNSFDFDFYFCDETALKTIARSNPAILKLRNGTIVQKLHWNDSDNLILD